VDQGGDDPQMKRLRKFNARWGSFAFLVLGLVFIIGFHDVPALWVPMVLIFLSRLDSRGEI
jgi:hypothetical protein